MTSSHHTPSLAKLALGDMLARLRQASGRERHEVAAHVGVDTETLRRWEIGKVAPRPMAIRDLGQVYGATPEEISRMCTLSLDSKKRGMFEGNNVPPDLRVLYETEASTSLIRSLELEHVPGLLQTPEYHRIMQAAQMPADPEHSKTIRELRARRQEILFGRRDLPEMQFIIGPAALFYMSSHDGMRDEQLERLREVAAMPRADIRVITTFHPGMLGSFTVLTPRASALGARPFAYVEDIDGGRYVETHDVVSQYEAVFEAVRMNAQPLEEYLK